MLINSTDRSGHDDAQGTQAQAGSSSNGGEAAEQGAIYTCKYPACSRQYASTDGARLPYAALKLAANTRKHAPMPAYWAHLDPWPGSCQCYLPGRIGRL